MRCEAQKREERPTTAAQLQNQTIRPANPTTPQAHGQLARAAQLELEADRLQAYGAYPAARRARHQANRLRQLARGSRPEPPPVDIAQVLSEPQLQAWAHRGAA